MAANTRSKSQREQDLITLAELYLRGHNQFEMAAAIGVSRQQVGYDIATLHKRWKDSQLININEAKIKELEKIDAVEQEAWSAWRRSIGRKTKIKRTVEADAEKTERVRWHEAGDARFLDVVNRCIDKRCAILGLDAAKEGREPVTVNIQNNVASITTTPEQRRTELLGRIAALRERAGDGGNRGPARAIDAESCVSPASDD